MLCFLIKFLRSPGTMQQLGSLPMYLLETLKLLSPKDLWYDLERIVQRVLVGACKNHGSLQHQGIDLLLLLRSLFTGICRAITQQGSRSTWPSLSLPAFSRLTPLIHPAARSTQCFLTCQISPRSGSRHRFKVCTHACVVQKESAVVDRGPCRQRACHCQMCVSFQDTVFAGQRKHSPSAVHFAWTRLQ